MLSLCKKSRLAASLALVAATLILSACGGNSGSSPSSAAQSSSQTSTGQSTGNSGGGSSSPPTISGSPATSVVAGQKYTFTPATTDPSGGTLTFSITNMPSWATFSTSTGQLSGTPSSSNVGTYSNIGISVSDGTHSASLASFSVNVTAVVSSGSPTISGTPSASV